MIMTVASIVTYEVDCINGNDGNCNLEGVFREKKKSYAVQIDEKKRKAQTFHETIRGPPD